MLPLPLLTAQFDQLRTTVFASNSDLGQVAAHFAADLLTEAIQARGSANLILATGNSQLSFLQAIRSIPLDWTRINLFHMDEYVGLPAGHPASFPTFLRAHLVDYVSPRQFFPIEPSPNNPQLSCDTYAQLIDSFPPDLVVLGIGENGHLAFNDPPYADFNDPLRVKIVQLDQRSRLQQVGEGHFANLDAVPTHAVTLTIPALLSARHMLCLVPEARKAPAVRATLLGPIQESCPASILRRAAHCQLFLDLDSASEVLHAFQSSS